MIKNLIKYVKFQFMKYALSFKTERQNFIRILEIPNKNFFVLN